MNKKLSFMPQGWDDYLYWQTQDNKTFKRINLLIKDIYRNRYEGIGKPEPLKHDLSGYWSREIDDKNRIVYKITDTEVIILSCRTHYGDK